MRLLLKYLPLLPLTHPNPCEWFRLPVWAMQHNLMWCEVGGTCFSSAQNSPEGTKAWRQTERSQMWKAVWPCAYGLEAPGSESILYQRQVQLSFSDQSACTSSLLFIVSRKQSFLYINKAVFISKRFNKELLYLSPFKLSKLKRCWPLLSRTLLFNHVWCSAFTSKEGREAVQCPCLETAETSKSLSWTVLKIRTKAHNDTEEGITMSAVPQCCVILPWTSNTECGKGVVCVRVLWFACVFGIIIRARGLYCIYHFTNYCSVL